MSMLMNDEETRRLFEQVDAMAAYLESASTQAPVAHSSPSRNTSPRNGPTLLGSGLAGPAAVGAAPRTLNLGRGAAPEAVHTLTQLGQQLRTCTAQLQEHVDVRMVEFFDHLRRKEFKQLGDIAERQQVVPEGFRAYRTEDVRGSGAREDVDDVTRTLRRLGDSRRVAGPSPSPCPAASTATTTRAHAGYLKPTYSSSVAARRAGTDVVPADADTTTTNNADTATGLGGSGAMAMDRSVFGATALSTRERHISAERDVANVLQAHLHLLLESALTQADGTCAAVFIHDVDDGQRVRGGTQDAINRAHTEASRAPRFLHCIAKLNTDGKFPDEISYASMNALVSVTTTGIAVNMADMDSYFASGHATTTTPAGGSGPSAAATASAGATGAHGDAAARNWAVKHLNVRNCVIVPLRRYGCVIIADKSRRVENQQANGARFTMFDEHIAWATALLCDGLLQRYQRDILLRHTWQPPAGIVSLLRPVALLNSIAVEAAETSAPPRPDARASAHRHAESGFSGKAAEVLAYMDGAISEPIAASRGVGTHSPTSPNAEALSRKAFSSMPKALTMVRTSAADHANMAEIFSSTRVMSPTGKATERVGKTGQPALSEEDLFQAAADYIQRLETLWRDSLATANTHQSVREHYERQMERKDETISALENKVQTLTARLVHLERERGANAGAGATTTTGAHTEAGKRKSRA